MMFTELETQLISEIERVKLLVLEDAERYIDGIAYGVVPVQIGSWKREVRIYVKDGVAKVLATKGFSPL